MAKKSFRKYYRDEEFLIQVGKRIENLMKERKITHEVFYNDISINPHRLIVGKINMTISTFKKICDYFKLAPQDFFK